MLYQISIIKGNSRHISWQTILSFRWWQRELQYIS